MKNIIYTAVLGFALFLTACTTTKYIYKYPEIPAGFPRPIVSDYNVSIIEFNDVQFYALTPEDARTLSENWINYKAYSEANEKLLREIRRGDYNVTIEK
jgi:hypothetical protein